MALGEATREQVARRVAATIAYLQDLAGQAQGAMQTRAPWRDRTGLARQGLTAATQVEDHGERVVVTLDMGHSVAYGVLLELGTDPHEIRPRAAKVLAWERDGRMHFARRVMHPGTKNADGTSRFAIVEPVAREMREQVVAGVRRLWGAG